MTNVRTGPDSTAVRAPFQPLCIPVHEANVAITQTRSTLKNTLEAHSMLDAITFAFTAHAETPAKPANAFRKFDGRTPYAIHPTWCALTMLHESTLDEALRIRCAYTLIFHDILEDTTSRLPEGTDPQIAALVDEMTFPDGSAQEQAELWDRSKEARLCKLFDKVSNHVSPYKTTPEKAAKANAHLSRLIEDVEANFGILNITRIARALLNT